MNPKDQEEYDKGYMLNRCGMGLVFLSFVGSFWFGRYLRKTTERKKFWFVANLGQSVGALYLFLYSVYIRGTIEEKLATKYLWMFND